MKMPITLGPHSIFCSMLLTCVFKHCPATGMQNGDKSSPRIISVDQALSVKMLINLGMHGIFRSDIVYYCILT